jgi:hypothetical protein
MHDWNRTAPIAIGADAAALVARGERPVHFGGVPSPAESHQTNVLIEFD